mgnify:CR=1 FL=1
MANTKHYNNIKIARGTRARWDGKGSYGELFYDKNTHGVYIVDENNKIRRFGGFESIVLKGTIDSKTYNTVCQSAEPGDAYIVTGKISVTQREVTFDNDGNVTRSETNVRTYDDFFKNGQVIIFTDEDVEAVPNAVVLDAANSEGAKGIVTLAGTAEAIDLEYDSHLAEVANVTGEEIRDVQTALDTLFNEKMEYIGSFKDVAGISTLVLDSTDAKPATNSDNVWAIIAKFKGLLMGQSIVYSGDTKAVKILDDTGAEQTVTIRTNTMIVNNAGTIYTIPLGASDARDIGIKLTGNIKSDEDSPTFETVDANGNKVEDKKESEIETVQHALDFLHQAKADLNSNGKIPLNEIPSTMIGALQYVGTTTITPAATGKTQLTVAQLAALMAGNKTGDDSWEKEGPGKDADADSMLKFAAENLDEGDYVIIAITGPTVNNEEGNALTRQVEILEEEGGKVLFTVSNGDHVIVNSVDASGKVISFDHLDSSAAVDAVNGLMGSVHITGTTREVGTGFTANAETATTDTIVETSVTTDQANHDIETSIGNAVLEPTEIDAHNIPQASGKGRSIIASDLSINDTIHDSAYKTGDDKTHNTELIGKKADGTKVVVEFPDESGKLSVTTGDGTKDFLPKYDEHGNLIDSTVSQTEDSTSHLKSVNLGDDFHINYEELAKLFQYINGAKTITRLFDHDDTNINSESWGAREHDEDTLVVLDEDSAIDGGEWD